MKKVLIALLAVFAVIIVSAFILFGWGVGVNNRLVSLDEEANAAWAQVETQLQRRFDLIPNLVETVKGYAAHEKEVLTEVTNARSRVGSAQTVDQKMAANNELSGALSRLLVVMERYPDLKANQNFLVLQSQLEGTENRISVERGRYNEVIKGYNTAVRSFPGSFIASMRGFERRKPFEAAAGADKAPSVKF